MRTNTKRAEATEGVLGFRLVRRVSIFGEHFEVRKVF